MVWVTRHALTAVSEDTSISTFSTFSYSDRSRLQPSPGYSRAWSARVTHLQRAPDGTHDHQPIRIEHDGPLQIDVFDKK